VTPRPPFVQQIVQQDVGNAVHRCPTVSSRQRPYNAGVGGSNPSPPTADALVTSLLFGIPAMTPCARPRTGRGSGRFRVLLALRAA
jgi:hypothetical protein